MSALTLPTVLSMARERSVQEAARLIQASIVAARDEAARAGDVRGIRLIPDPTLPGAYSAIIPLAPAPDYSEGLASPNGFTSLPDGTLPGTCLVVESSPVTADGRPATGTSWYDNIRVGEKIRFGGTGPFYTVVGPVQTPNPEGFVNTAVTFVRTFEYTNPDGSKVAFDAPVQLLFLTDGVDDDGDGFIDEGVDGIDNDLDGLVDEADEWEVERWRGVLPAASPYVIRRRPVPASATRMASLPSGAVVDATTWDTTRERSRLPVGPGGFIDVMFDARGRPLNPPGGVNSGMLFFWIAEKGDVHDPFASPPGWFNLPMAKGTAGYPDGLPTLDGDALIVAVGRDGEVASAPPGDFDAPGVPVAYAPADPPDYPRPAAVYLRAEAPFRAVTVGQPR